MAAAATSLVAPPGAASAIRAQPMQATKATTLSNTAPAGASPPPSVSSSRSSTMSSGTSAPNATAAPPPLAPGLSFQSLRPETEWNDLPEEMIAPGGGNGAPARTTHLSPPSAPASGASSRSSSASRAKKKTRAYPAAAFGN